MLSCCLMILSVLPHHEAVPRPHENLWDKIAAWPQFEVASHALLFCVAYASAFKSLEGRCLESRNTSILTKATTNGKISERVGFAELRTSRVAIARVQLWKCPSFRKSCADKTDIGTSPPPENPHPRRNFMGMGVQEGGVVCA